jgi:hypothetical protein
MFKQKEPDCLRQAKHKNNYNDIGGDIMFCQDCEQTIFTTEIVNQCENHCEDHCLSVRERHHQCPKDADNQIFLMVRVVERQTYEISARDLQKPFREFKNRNFFW